jgi:hypothetical protein
MDVLYTAVLHQLRVLFDDNGKIISLMLLNYFIIIIYLNCKCVFTRWQ